jgi:predicted secreted protein
MRLVLASLFLTMCACGPGPQAGAAPDLVVTGDNATSPIEIAVGQRLDMRFQVAFGSGMSWVVGSISSDAAQFVETRTIPSDKTGGLKTGSADVQSLVFLGRREGETEIVLHFKRPWEKTAAPKSEKRIGVRVLARR